MFNNDLCYECRKRFCFPNDTADRTDVLKFIHWAFSQNLIGIDSLVSEWNVELRENFFQSWKKAYREAKEAKDKHILFKTYTRDDALSFDNYRVYCEHNFSNRIIHKTWDKCHTSTSIFDYINFNTPMPVIRDPKKISLLFNEDQINDIERNFHKYKHMMHIVKYGDEFDMRLALGYNALTGKYPNEYYTENVGAKCVEGIVLNYNNPF